MLYKIYYIYHVKVKKEKKFILSDWMSKTTTQLRTFVPSDHRGWGTGLCDRREGRSGETQQKPHISDGLTMLTLAGRADPSNQGSESLLVFNQGSFTLHELWGRQCRSTVSYGWEITHLLYQIMFLKKIYRPHKHLIKPLSSESQLYMETVFTS